MTRIYLLMKNKSIIMNHLKLIKKLFTLILLMSVSSYIYSQTDAVPVESGMSDSDKLNLVLTFLAFVLLIPIYYMSKIFGNVLITNLKKKYDITTNSIVLIAGSLLISSSLLAQTGSSTPVATPSTFDHFNFVTWMLLLVLFVEILVLAFYTKLAFKLINPSMTKEEKEKKWTLGKWWKKSNNFIPFEEEVKIDTGHSYDGIRELDNGIPPWFSASFILCILFAIIYLWNYHVVKISPLQIEEFTTEMETAKLAQEKLLATQGSTLDENNIQLLSGTDMEEGKKLFATNCAACHANDGGGATGPNLTDEFWIHGGNANSIFKTIKYGVREKGMIPWKDNFNDNQILKIASYVNTLKGTKPAAPKAPQGDKYEEKAVALDSTSTVALVPSDTTKK